MDKRKKGQTTIYQTLHRKLMIEQHEPDLKPGVNSNVSCFYLNTDINDNILNVD